MVKTIKNNGKTPLPFFSNVEIFNELAAFYEDELKQLGGLPLRAKVQPS